MNEWLGRGLTLAVGVTLGWLAGSQASGDSGYESDESGEAAPAAPAGQRRGGGGGSALGGPREELKMVLVVNSELKMGKGKIGAQCAHAAVGAVERLRGRRQAALLRRWEACGQPKICLQAASTQELRQLAAAAAEAALPTFIVQDAGRTQVAAGSRTVLSIGPGPRSAVDRITGHLKLL